jgi:putative addiction module component (TIGR02574 family)
MTAIAEEFPEVFALPRERRAELVEALQESLASEAEAEELPQAFVEELRRRASELRADPSIGVPWEVVEAAAAARRKK